MFDLNTYLEERRKIVDEALNKILPPAARKPAMLHKAMRYSVFSGGKRIRPILCLAAAEALGSSYKKALLPSAAIELLHTYTLIHDDLPCMDDDDFRRGKPTSHRVFGEANAVLAGDALQTMAFEALAGICAPPPYQPTRLVSELACAAGSVGVIGGQVEDLASSQKRQTPAMVKFIHLHKTADLFRAAMRMGAIAACANPKQLEALTLFGANLGLAFQMTDDILDEAQPSRENNSHNQKELTCLSIFTPTEARRKAATFIRKAASSLNNCRLRSQPLEAIAGFVLDRKH